MLKRTIGNYIPYFKINEKKRRNRNVSYAMEFESCIMNLC